MCDRTFLNMPLDRSPTRDNEESTTGEPSQDGQFEAGMQRPTATGGPHPSTRIYPESAGVIPARALMDEACISFNQRVRLPQPLWREMPTHRFNEVEATFALNRITSDEAKFRHVLNNLDLTIIPFVTDLITNPPSTNKYEAIKKRIISSFGKSIKVLNIPPRPGVVALSDWSDSKLDELVANIKVPNSIKSPATHKSMLYQFYDFYFNGALPHGSSPHQLIYPFICLLTYDDQDERSYFIKDKHFANTGFFETAAPIVPVPSLSFTHAAIAPYDTPSQLRAEQLREIQNLYLSVTGEKQKRFFTVIKHLINNYSDNESSENNKSILRVTGFLSLLLFRGICKDSTQLARGVNKKIIKDHIHNLTNWPLANGYSPPCKTCVENCASDLDKGNSHSNSMMALILSHWKDAPAEQRQTKGLIPRIQAALLTHTAGNGLGLITLMYVATDILGITIQELMKYTLNQNSIGSWALLGEFIYQFLHKQWPEETYMWARLINDGYFTQFAARSHPYLAGVFAGIIDSHQTIGSIKQAAWFRLRKFQAEHGYEWGSSVVEVLSQTKDIPPTQHTILRYPLDIRGISQ